MTPDAGADPSQTSRFDPRRLQRVPAPVLAFGGIALIALAFAFVGLDATAFDVDELFTLTLINHSGGLPEVFNRALGDTHPPLYYFVLYEWTRLGPLSETMVRLPSAVFAVGAVLLATFSVRRDFSPSALAFMAAVAALSNNFFHQSQYARDYGLALLGSAALLACAITLRRNLAGSRPAPALIATGLVGLAASLSHAYVLLQTGMVLLFALLFWTKSWRTRIAIVAIGLAILAVNAAYFVTLMHATDTDLHDLWFENSTSEILRMLRGAFFGNIVNGVEAAIIVLLGVLIWRRFRRRSPDQSQPPARGVSLARLGGFVFLGVFACGMAVSYLVAPSLSDRNLLTASPFIWVLFAALYDATVATWRGRGAMIGVAIITALVAINLTSLPGRLLARGEDWRLSAKYVAAQPGCADAEIPVVQPFVFGPDNPYFREMARKDFFGWYYQNDERLSSWMPAEFGGRAPAPPLRELLTQRMANSGGADACPVLAWAVHDVEGADAVHIAEDLARIDPARPVVIQEINSYRRDKLGWKTKPDALVFLTAPSGADPTKPPVVAQPQFVGREAKQIGDRIVVTYLSTETSKDEPVVQFDKFRLQRWRGDKLINEVTDTVQRFSCNPKVPGSRRRAWPDLTEPGCSSRPTQPWEYDSPI